MPQFRSIATASRSAWRGASAPTTRERPQQRASLLPRARWLSGHSSDGLAAERACAVRALEAARCAAACRAQGPPVRAAGYPAAGTAAELLRRFEEVCGLAALDDHLDDIRLTQIIARVRGGECHQPDRDMPEITDLTTELTEETDPVAERAVRGEEKYSVPLVLALEHRIGRSVSQAAGFISLKRHRRHSFTSVEIVPWVTHRTVCLLRTRRRSIHAVAWLRKGCTDARSDCGLPTQQVQNSTSRGLPCRSSLNRDRVDERILCFRRPRRRRRLSSETALLEHLSMSHSSPRFEDD